MLRRAHSNAATRGNAYLRTFEGVRRGVTAVNRGLPKARFLTERASFRAETWLFGGVLSGPLWSSPL